MRIALFRPLGLASLLCSVPALRALDAAYPHAEITLIGLAHLREVAARLHRYLDGFAAFPGFPGIPGAECDLDAIPGFFERMHGAGEIANPLMVRMARGRGRRAALGAARRAPRRAREGHVSRISAPAR